ncbi:MAG TPA: cob(I)yrinic acid a,c-diamide adenosyltransferase [Candidatus Polarisedimenticolia bacterium]|jgi:cob(I)alamin adenosyltransferase|nr:cob(I)yrinic acid a,c-diamide adenosyltransferase [Candidatus Polarisedimenticolia bacterium]
MKIYTKTGDSGETGLFGGGRVKKSDLRVEAYGDVDEVNAHLGRALTLLANHPVQKEIEEIQADLFTLGADLATVPAAAAKSTALRLSPQRALRLEELIDRWESEIAPLKHFILPGGSPGGAALQVCRAVCRRAERSVVRLSIAESVNSDAVVYLNRLSDLLFVLSRWVNAREGAPETIWKGAGP